MIICRQNIGNWIYGKSLIRKLDRLNSMMYNFLKNLELRLDAKKKVRFDNDVSDVRLKRFTKYTKAK